MRYPGFIGPAYQSRSKRGALDTCINLYPELLESNTGRNVAALYLSPGLTEVLNEGAGPIRGMFGIDTHLFWVSGATLYQVQFSGGTPGAVTNWGSVGNDSEPVYMAANAEELFVVSNGNGFILREASLSQIASNFPTGNARGAGYLDGYFITLDVRDWADSQYARFHISNLDDGLTWDAADFGEFRVDLSKILNFVVSHRELWLFGNHMSQVWENTGGSSILGDSLVGSATFPLVPNQSATIEHGAAAKDSPIAIDNTAFWLGSGRRGHGTAYRGDGYLPQRVSTHAVEDAWRGYSDITDAISWSYEQAGHQFWVLYFPTADKTWVYDITASIQMGQHMWHERAFWTGSAYEAHLGRAHAFADGMNLVGSRNDGKIYRMGLDLFDDDGSAIRWERTAPHVHDEERRTFFDRLEVDMETNIGDPAANPEISMEFTDDSGANWSTARTAQIGESDGSPSASRIFWPRLGSSRQRAFRVYGVTSAKIALIGAYLRVRPASH